MKPIPPADQLLEAALKAANLRQSVIANNIANIDAPNFRRHDVQFKDVLAKAVEGGKTDLSSLEPRILTPGDGEVNANGNDVDLDTELGEMMKTNGQYKLCIRLLAKLYKRVEMAMSGE